MNRDLLLRVMIYFLPAFLVSQTGDNCFLEDHYDRYADIPQSVEKQKPAGAPAVFITVDADHVLQKVSPYIFGTAVAAWCGHIGEEPVLLEHLEALEPDLIRFPGGSWGDIFFWDGTSPQIPEVAYYDDGDKWEHPDFQQYGKGSWSMTTDEFYYMIDEVWCDALITINYGYARYGTAPDPVAQAAHYAAEWVRYDDGYTRFWEIGNENAGSWEAGYRIDTSLNQDGQPQIISGEIYGRHFLVFADSMRKAAEERNETIYIGAQILHYNAAYDNWNPPNKKWNEGVFKTIGDAADFYVVHNYFGAKGGRSAKGFLNGAREIESMMSFIKNDIQNKGAALKPVALTEWNITAEVEGEINKRNTSFISGMQAVLIWGEMIKNGYGMACRWLIASGYDNGDTHGMFNDGNEPDVPVWNPRPDYFYMYYFKRFFGDHLVQSSVTGNEDIVAYASTYSSGHIGLVVVNKGSESQIVHLNVEEYHYGDQYYIIGLTGGDDNGEFSQVVYVNDYGPNHATGGPIDDLEDIEVYAYSTGDNITFMSPALSVQFVLIEGEVQASVKPVASAAADSPDQVTVLPSPARKIFKIHIPPGQYEQIDIIDILGRVVQSQDIDPEQTMIQCYMNLNSGTYFARFYSPQSVFIKKLVIFK